MNVSLFNNVVNISQFSFIATKISKFYYYYYNIETNQCKILNRRLEHILLNLTFEIRFFQNFKICFQSLVFAFTNIQFVCVCVCVCIRRSVITFLSTEKTFLK